MRALLAFVEPFVLMLLGTVALASVLPPRGSWAHGFAIATEAAIVLLFFLHGAKLSRAAILDGARSWRLHGLVLAVSFALFPLLGLAAARVAPVPPALATGLLFLTLLPSTVQSSIAFTSMARGNVAAAVCAASFSNLIGIAATPLLAGALIGGGGSGRGPGWAAAGQIVAQLLLPFVVGHLARPLIGAAVQRHRALVTVVDRGSILLVVYTAFGAAVIEGLWARVGVGELAVLAVACTGLLAAVLAATWAIGRATRLAYGDRVVLLFCGSKKSLASGVPMAGVLFPPAAIGLVILPLMLFHQLQLIACAVIARRLGAGAE